MPLNLICHKHSSSQKTTNKKNQHAKPYRLDNIGQHRNFMSLCSNVLCFFCRRLIISLIARAKCICYLHHSVGALMRGFRAKLPRDPSRFPPGAARRPWKSRGSGGAGAGAGQSGLERTGVGKAVWLVRCACGEWLWPQKRNECPIYIHAPGRHKARKNW